MKELFLMIFAATLLLATFSCTKKKTCKECGWYKEGTTELVESVGQKCDGDIDAFIATQARTPSTGTINVSATVKAVTKQVAQCN